MSTQGKADATVLPAPENFTIKNHVLVQLHSRESAEDLGADDTALGTIKPNSCLQTPLL